MTPPDAVLCIPGNWTDRLELGARIVRESEGYVFAGRILMHSETNDKFELQFEAADPRVVTAFAHAGHHWGGTADMERITAHASVVYLIGKCGVPINAERLMLAGEGLLKAGGLGVKVESSGIAHSPGAWRGFAADRHHFSAHDAFVLYVRGAQIYSCGMHHFGLPEAMVDQGDASDPAELLRIFTRYLLTENPTIRVGQTFSTAQDAPLYRIVEGAGVDYGQDSLFHNPYGMLRLMAVSEQTTSVKTGKWWRGFMH